jgi:hypothetical protein
MRSQLLSLKYLIISVQYICSWTNKLYLRARCLQYHVARWKTEAASKSQPSLTATTSSEDHGAMLSKQDTKAISSILTPTASSPYVATSQTKESTKLHPSNDRLFPDGDSFTFRKPLRISKSNMSSMLSRNAPLLDFDPTLYGDYEIPWVPPSPNQETEFHGADITLEEFYQFIEHNPGMHILRSKFSVLTFP